MAGLSQRPSDSRRPGDSIVGWSAAVCGVIGLVAGFIRGLFVYAPTAWAAALEVGVPAVVAGVVIGLGIVGVRGLARRVRGRSL